MKVAILPEINQDVITRYLFILLILNCHCWTSAFEL